MLEENIAGFSYLGYDNSKQLLEEAFGPGKIPWS